MKFRIGNFVKVYNRDRSKYEILKIQSFAPFEVNCWACKITAKNHIAYFANKDFGEYICLLELAELNHKEKWF